VRLDIQWNWPNPHLYTDAKRRESHVGGENARVGPQTAKKPNIANLLPI